MNLRLGATMTTVAAILGVKYDTLTTWLRRGRTTKRNPYRKFWGDVVQAIGNARLLAEAEVKSRDPFKWLRYSASSRLLGDEWREDPEQSQTVNLQGPAANQSQLTQQDVMEALIELRRSGIDLNALVDTGAKSLTLAAPVQVTTPGIVPALSQDVSIPENGGAGGSLTGQAESGSDDVAYDDDEEGETTEGEHWGEGVTPSLPPGFLQHIQTMPPAGNPSALPPIQIPGNRALPYHAR
jgi:hypothetical protein